MYCLCLPHARELDNDRRIHTLQVALDLERVGECLIEPVPRLRARRRIIGPDHRLLYDRLHEVKRKHRRRRALEGRGEHRRRESGTVERVGNAKVDVEGQSRGADGLVRGMRRVEEADV